MVEGLPYVDGRVNGAQIGTDEDEARKRNGLIPIPPQLLSHMKSWCGPSQSSIITYSGRSIRDVKEAFAIVSDMVGNERTTPQTLKYKAATLGSQTGPTLADATDYFATKPEIHERV